MSWEIVYRELNQKEKKVIYLTNSYSEMQNYDKKIHIFLLRSRRLNSLFRFRYRRNYFYQKNKLLLPHLQIIIACFSLKRL